VSVIVVALAIVEAPAIAVVSATARVPGATAAVLATAQVPEATAAVHLVQLIVWVIVVSEADPEIAPLAAVPEASVVRVRVQAVAEDPRAWAAAAAVEALVVAVAAAAAEALAEVVAVAAEAAAVEAVVVEGGNEVMKNKNTKTSRIFAVGLICLLYMVLLSVAPSSAQTAAIAKGRSFPTAQAAADALIEAAEKYDETALTEILGPDSYDILHTGEPARDREVAKEFATLARVKTNVAAKPKNNPRLAYLSVGEDDWPFPVPIVKVGSGWYFDTKAGRQEVLYRRVGSNELTAIQICRGYVEAQHEYALIKKGTSGVNHYAQRIISTAGTQDGLAWKNEDGTWGGPIGENVAGAIARGYSSRSEPYHGYFFKVLKGQGPAAPLGELDFVVKDVMIGGFALIAFPAQYRVTGVKTFMVSHDGVVYEKDLGPKTPELAGAIERFNPDKSWTPVLDDDQ